MNEQKLVIASKINIAAVVTLLVGVMGIWNLIPEQIENQIYETMLIVSPLMIMVFRTYFTNTRLTWGGG